MPPNNSIRFIFFCLMLSLAACQSSEEGVSISTGDNIAADTISEVGLSEGHGRLDLSLETLEKQSKDKAEAAEKLAKAREQRIIIETEKPSQKVQDVNIASFARSTNNKKGQKIYSRSSLPTFDHWTECALFKTDDDAQRFFLGSGGPVLDRKNLDPDGDGLACDWDPSIYRQLSTPDD